MGRHSKPEQPQGAGNPTGVTNEGTGPLRDSWTRQAVVDSWNIDAAYDKPKSENGSEKS